MIEEVLRWFNSTTYHLRLKVEPLYWNLTWKRNGIILFEQDVANNRSEECAEWDDYHFMYMLLPCHSEVIGCNLMLHKLQGNFTTFVLPKYSRLHWNRTKIWMIGNCIWKDDVNAWDTTIMENSWGMLLIYVANLRILLWSFIAGWRCRISDMVLKPRWPDCIAT